MVFVFVCVICVFKAIFYTHLHIIFSVHKTNQSSINHMFALITTTFEFLASRFPRRPRDNNWPINYPMSGPFTTRLLRPNERVCSMNAIIVQHIFCNRLLLLTCIPLSHLCAHNQVIRARCIWRWPCSLASVRCWAPASAVADGSRDLRYVSSLLRGPGPKSKGMVGKYDYRDLEPKSAFQQNQKKTN